jgi:serine/threonine-protein kinase
MAEVLLSVMDAGGGVRKVVVLKRIWPDLATDPDFVAMFHDEAQLAIRLNHPNVVQTLEVVEAVGELAIAMEYLHGQSLTAVLNHHLTGAHQLSLALRLRILVDILAGLHHAHELRDYHGNPLGVVHRDVSPHNVFVTYDGQVKLMDFGVAKTIAAGYRTRPGAIKGKLAYLAPEYFRGGVIDRRADVFAVGVMLWELLAGRRLWQGLSEAQIVHQLAAATSLPALPADAIRPPALDAVCLRALALDPSERHPTAAALESDLQQVLAGSADSHARTLGRVVSHAFGAARAEREAMIAHALETSGPTQSPAAGSTHLHLLDAPDEAKVSWTTEVDAFLSAADELLDVTVVDPPVAPEPEPRAGLPRRGRWVAGALVGTALTAAVLGLTVREWRHMALSFVSRSPAGKTTTAAPSDVPSPPASMTDAAAAPPASARATDVPARPGRRSVRRFAAHTTRDRRGHEGRERYLLEALTVDRLSPASLRRIDEGDPFR